MSNSDTQYARFARVFDEAGPGVDIPVRDICMALFGEYSEAEHRTWHQRLGKHVTRYNRAGSGRVAPGEVKRTYRLTRSA